ncbi:MAG TPA: TetR/AcrR family transcriptional regulator [Acidimicrobiales bacterium]|nr:TetR/AcrR family transcriptional regulator [Acidimicrobiales bacterium]
MATASTAAARRRPRDRKDQIARTAAGAFSDRGYHGVGIDDVAASVGITGGAVYRHFANKYDLLRSAVFDAVGALEVAATAVPGEHLNDLLGRFAELGVGRRELGVLLQREARHLTADDQTELRQRVARVTAYVSELLRAERPGLAANDESLILRSAYAAMASPSYHRIALVDTTDDVILHRVLSVVVATTPQRDRAVAAAPRHDVERVSRRETLLSAASQLFARRGYGAVRMEDVGAAAGIAGPSIYEHFDSKAALLTAALTRGAEWLQFSLSRALATADDRSAVERVVSSYVEFVIEHTDLIGVLLTETVNLPEAERHAVRRLQHDYIAEWVQLVTAARPDLTDAHARFLTQGVLGIVNDNARSSRARERADLPAVLTHLGLEVLDA